MNRYVIESPHAPEDCERIVREISGCGNFHYFEWGCHAGVHTGWAIVDTDNPEHARQIVPWMVRDKARIAKVDRFDNVDKLHSHKKI